MWDVREHLAPWLGLLGLAQRRTAGFQTWWIILVDQKLEVSHQKLRSVSGRELGPTLCRSRPSDSLREGHERFASSASSSQVWAASIARSPQISPLHWGKIWGDTTRILTSQVGTKGTHWGLIPRSIHPEGKSQHKRSEHL